MYRLVFSYTRFHEQYISFPTTRLPHPLPEMYVIENEDMLMM